MAGLACAFRAVVILAFELVDAGRWGCGTGGVGLWMGWAVGRR